MLGRLSGTGGSASSSSSSSSTRTTAGGAEQLDFDEEARKLWASLNLDPNAHKGGQWNPTDPIFRHPTGGGTIFVGNQTAAENLAYLQQLGVTRVVNCTTGASRIPNFHEGRGITYYTFTISNWQTCVNATHTSVLSFANPMFAFIEEAISNGESVLVHCLAGAHRAGTTGCACLMHFAGLDAPTAIRTAKRCRPIIDPIGQLPEFLVRLQRAKEAEEPQQQG